MSAACLVPAQPNPTQGLPCLQCARPPAPTHAEGTNKTMARDLGGPRALLSSKRRRRSLTLLASSLSLSLLVLLVCALSGRFTTRVTRREWGRSLGRTSSGQTARSRLGPRTPPTAPSRWFQALSTKRPSITSLQSRTMAELRRTSGSTSGRAW